MFSLVQTRIWACRNRRLITVFQLYAIRCGTVSGQKLRDALQQASTNRILA